MNDYSLSRPASREKSRSRYGQSGRNYAENGFTCSHCHRFVSTEARLSGVQNRNHCPYCLWSRHLDLFRAGDRLSACKASMQPIGLTIKVTRKKYGPGHGELMLIHLCAECSALSINRIAADDDPQMVFTIFDVSLQLEASLQTRLDARNVRALDVADKSTVQAQLVGREPELAEMLFKSSALELV
jgi:hypothetical protein